MAININAYVAAYSQIYWKSPLTYFKYPGLSEHKLFPTSHNLIKQEVGNSLKRYGDPKKVISNVQMVLILNSRLLLLLSIF